MIKKIPTTLYCCFKYAMAPTRTCRAMVRIVSVPSEVASMLRKKIQANTSAAREAAGVIQNSTLSIGLVFCFLY